MNSIPTQDALADWAVRAATTKATPGLARIMGKWLSERLSQPVIIEKSAECLARLIDDDRGLINSVIYGKFRRRYCRRAAG
jgi:hypothetical protein